MIPLQGMSHDMLRIHVSHWISVSFFAVPNWGLRPPGDHKKGPHPPEEDEEHIISEILSKPTESERFASLEGLLDRSDDDNDHKKEVIKSIIRAVLSYHILPAALPAAELAKNLTHPTSLKLKDGSLDGQALRVRIAVVPKPLRPAIFVNYFAKVIVPDIKAKNGANHNLPTRNHLNLTLRRLHPCR